MFDRDSEDEFQVQKKQICRRWSITKILPLDNKRALNWR